MPKATDPATLPGAVPVFGHQEAGQKGVLFGMFFLLAAEGLALHLLLNSWKPWVAWLVTSTNVLTVVWLLIEYRLTATRPHLITPHTFVLRAGTTWKAEIPRESIQAVLAEPPHEERRRTNTAFMASPTHWLMVEPPVLLRGPFGIKRNTAAVGITPDDPSTLECLRREAD